MSFCSCVMVPSRRACMIGKAAARASSNFCCFSVKSAVDPWDNDISRWFADQRTGSLDPLGDGGTLLGETVIGVGVAVLAAIGVLAVAALLAPGALRGAARGGHRRLLLRGHPRGHRGSGRR